MLKIYGVMIEVLREVKPVIDAIEKRDRHLADQMRRAMQSVVLNTAEGMGSHGGNRRQRYHSALGSAREAWACIEVGAVLGYVGAPSNETTQRFNHVIGTLVTLTA